MSLICRRTHRNVPTGRTRAAISLTSLALNAAAARTRRRSLPSCSAVYHSHDQWRIQDFLKGQDVTLLESPWSFRGPIMQNNADFMIP